MFPEWLLQPGMSAEPDSSPAGTVANGAETDPFREVMDPRGEYPNSKLASFGNTLRQWIRDLNGRAEPILARLYDDPAADALAGGLNKLVKVNEKFLNRCDELLRANFELEKLKGRPYALLDEAQEVSAEIIVLARAVVRENGFCEDGDPEVDSLKNSIVILSDQAMDGALQLLNQQTTNLILEPDLLVRFDPSKAFEPAEVVAGRLAAERDELMKLPKLNADQQLLLLRGSAQGTQLLRLIEVTSDTSKYNGSVLSAQEDYLGMILVARKVFDQSRSRVPDEISGKHARAIVAHFDSIAEEVAMRMEGLKYDLRQAWQRVWAKQEAERSKF